MLIFAILGSIRFYTEKLFYDKINKNIDSLNNKKQNITAIIYSKGKSTNSNYFILDNVVVGDTNFHRMRCYYQDDISIETKIGQTLQIEGTINKNNPPMNIGQFDSETYYRSLNETGMIYANSYTVLDNKYSFIRENLYRIKHIIINQIFKIFNKKYAGLFVAIFTNDKSYIDKEQKDLFNENGIAHILAISGLHLSILGLCLFELLRKRFSVKFSSIFVSIFILIYAIFIDASYTTLRAVIMLYIRFLSLGIGRSYDSKNTLYILAIVFIILNPYLLFNTGFQFSYVSVFSLNYVYKFKSKSLKKIINNISNNLFHNDLKPSQIEMVIPQVIILTLFLLPITIFNYFEFPLYSIFLNLIVIPLMTIVLVFGIIGLILSFLNLFLGRFLVGIVHFIFLFYEGLCNFINTLPYHTIMTGRPKFIYIIIFYLLLFLIHLVLDCIYKIKTNSYLKINNNLLFKIFKNIKYYLYKIKYRYVFVISAILILLSILLMSFQYINGINVEMLYIGQGDSLIIRNNKLCITIDGGSTTSKSNGKYILEPNLSAKAIKKIDIAFITHSDKDHTNCIEYLIENGECQINTLVLPIFAKTTKSYDNLKTLCENNNISIQYMKQGDIMKINEDLILYCISPSDNYTEAKDDVNEQSLCLKMIYKNKSAIFTGDIGNIIENKLANDKTVSEYLNSDILKVAHHGSKNSSSEEFLDKVSPKYAIVSYGIGNKYGHPNEQTLDRLSKRNIDTYLTGINGEIDINIKNDNIYVNTYLK